MGIIGIKTERTQIHSLSDVPADVLVADGSLDLKVPSTGIAVGLSNRGEWISVDINRQIVMLTQNLL